MTAAGGPGSATPAEIEAGLERQRDQLARSVDQLAARLDVKAQAKHRLTSDAGGPRPGLYVAGAVVVALVALTVWRARR